MPSYSDAFRSEAVIRLALNRYDYQKTAAEFDIPARTLRNWEKSFPKKGVSELLDRAVVQLLSNIPEFKRGSDWAIALGILLDKWLLLQGQPTDRKEMIFREIEQMTDDELNTLFDEFQTAARRGLASAEREAETPKTSE